MRCCGASLALLAGAVAAVDRPEVIELPMGFRPEGIAKGRDWIAFVSSLASTARVYDIDYDMVEELALSNGSSFINDVHVTKNYAYFTDTYQPQFYSVSLTSDGELMDMDPIMISLGGDFKFVPGVFNGNGIVASDDGSKLIIAGGATDSLYLVDPTTLDATAVTLSGLLATDGSVKATAALTSINADGLVRRCNTLWACENGLARVIQLIAVINLSTDWTSGYITRIFTSDLLDTPTTADGWINGIYAVNAKFGIQADEYANQTFEVVRIDRDEAMMGY